MNYALIFAGGTGQRMNTNGKPKQFLKLHGKEILIYTIEHFEFNSQIDGIVVVCLPEYIEFLENLLKKYNLKKVIKIVPGGATGQESIRNGLFYLDSINKSKDSIVLIHDGVRPLINNELIDNNIKLVRKCGTAITVSNAIETIARVGDNKFITNIEDRNTCKLARAPQSFLLSDIVNAHKKAIADGLTNFIDSAMLMNHYGFKLYFVEGPAENIKITTPSDFFLFKAYIDAKENYQILGL